jgi:hypothetical protein
MTMLAVNSSLVLLDRTLTASQARVNAQVKRILTSVIREAIVRPWNTHFYRVDFGPDVQPQFHIVTHDLYCACVLESDCPAVTAVKVYLQKGMGEPAKMPHPGYFPACPHVCPICGARAFYCPRLSSRHRGIGWSCEVGGTSHYWQNEVVVTQAAFTEKWGKRGVNLKAIDPQ